MSELNIPEHWAEVELGAVIEVKGGKRVPKGRSLLEAKTDYPYIRVTDMKNMSVNMGKIQYLSEDVYNTIKNYTISKNDLYITVAGTIGAVGTIPEELDNANLTENADKLTKFENTYYKFFLLHMLNANIVQEQIKDKTKQAAQPKLSVENIKKLLLCVPPFGEQERIVQKIESCFQKIDETEKALNEVEVLLTKYQESLLAKAFRGELISQDPKDEPASKLLEKIRAERAKNSNGKKVQEFAPISDAEKPFDLPKGWEWVRLGEVCSLVTDGEHQTPPRLNQGKMLLSAKNIRDGYIDYDNHDLISEDDFNKALKRCMPLPGDILMVSVGATIGRCSIVRESTQFALVRSVALIRPSYISTEYLDICFKSNFLQREISESQKSTGQPCLYLNAISNLKIPIPNREMQNELVKKINLELLCISRLRSNFRQNLKLLTSMKNSILSKAFQGTLVSRIDDEGSGLELLEKILKSKKDFLENSLEKSPEKTIKKITKKKGK